MSEGSKTVLGVSGAARTTPARPGARIGDGANLTAGARIRQYELIRELGRGGMGVVYAARDTQLGRRVAMKFLLHASDAIAERFLIEARATAQCTHENIVIIHEVGTFEDMPFMVLEYLEGTDLATQLEVGRLPTARVVDLMLPVARALARAHGLGVVHRDLKPENVFVTTSGQVKVLDFGIAKAVGSGDAKRRMPGAREIAAGLERSQFGATQGLVGTLPYMSPEQFGVDEIDHRSDVWAFGIMLFEMLAGHHPVEPLTMERVMEVAAALDEPMPSLGPLVECDPALVRIVDRCLRKRKAERMPSADELVDRLEELLPGRRGRQLGEGESPYPGLTAFQEHDADRFFGRSSEVAKMVARIRELPLTGVVGSSGVGKSSFVRAGVGPALKASGETWEVITIRPGRQPLAALAAIAARPTARTGPAAAADLAARDQLVAQLREQSGVLGAMLRGRARQIGTNILLFVDQFEELYTLVADAVERRAFTAALSAAADDVASPIRVVVSMRSDLLDRLVEDPRFTEEVTRGLVFLRPPDREGLREALVHPLEMAGYRFETPQIVDEMLDGLASTTGALPLLQFAAAKLWEVRDRDTRVIGAQSYRALGGVSGALALHADDVVRSQVGAAEKLTKQILQRLVTPERTRAIVELADLCAMTSDPEAVARLVDQLVAARLLVVQQRGDGGGATVEIVHESLIERWPMLRRWLDEDRDDAAYLTQLATAAKQWEAKGRPTGMLWRGDAMEDARRWYNARPRDLSPRDREFLEAAFRLARRGQRIRRALVAIAIVVLAGAAAGAIAMLLQVRSAELEAVAQRKQAQAAQATAESNEKTAADALAKMQEAERRRLAAEAARADAEGKNAAEVARAKAAEEEAASAKAAEAAAENMNRAQLLAHAKELEDEAAKLRAANAKAAEALRAARAAEAEKDAANRRLADEVTALKAKIKDAGIATKLR